MPWRLKYPDWYLQEKESLSQSNVYVEKYRLFEKFLISCGEIIVRGKSTKRFPILIYYPSYTPFKPPKVYILKELLTEEEISSISKDVSLLQKIVSSKKNILYLRHQMSDGEACFVAPDNLYKDHPQIFEISDILNRIAKWLLSIETGKYEFDSQEVEFFSHFPQKVNDLRVLLPQIFYDNSISQGEFYLSRYPSFFSIINTYLGFQIIGNNQSGVTLLPKIDDIFSKEYVNKFPGLLDAVTKEESLIQEIKKDKIIVGSWWDITKEPPPFEKIEYVLSLLSNNQQEAIKMIFKSKFYDYAWRAFDKVYIGFRFVNRHKEHEWILLRLNKIGNAPYGCLKIIDDVLIVLSNYKIEAIKSVKFTDDSHHLRNSQRAIRNILVSKSITIIGCGALGSEIADCIGKAGIGKMSLIDYELLEPNNPVRHLCGLNNMFHPKSIGVLFHILEHNPFVSMNAIDPLNSNILEQNINSFMSDESIGISTIADDSVEFFLNEQAVVNNRIVFYSRALRGGKVARIFRVIPGQDACYRCLLAYKLEKSDLFIDILEDETLPTIVNECNNPIRPASAADLKLISSITARIIIDYLQGTDTEYNHWIFQSESLEHIAIDHDEKMRIKQFKITPHPNCPLCSSKEKLKIRILKDQLGFLIQEAGSSADIETGGILIGFMGRNGYVYITKVTGPGPKAIRKNNWFARDVEYCQSIIDNEYEKNGQKGLYVGEWHYHPSKSNKPSNQDLKSLHEISEADNYKVQAPIMIIISNDSNLSCTVHPIGKKYYFTTYEETSSALDDL